MHQQFTDILARHGAPLEIAAELLAVVQQERRAGPKVSTLVQDYEPVDVDLTFYEYDSSEVDPATELTDIARERAQRAGLDVEVLTVSGESIPTEADQFDSVVCTWTLCSIPDAQAALGEMRRVLKPGGRYVFIEHGRSQNEGTARWQDRLNPIWLKLTGECNINRRIDEVVERGGFELSSLDRFLGDGPKILTTLYRGVATRA